MIVFLTKLRRNLPDSFYRVARKLFVLAQSLIPYRVKLNLYGNAARKIVPYKLIQDEDCVLQIGMPADLLNQARSRSLLFHFAGPQTLVLVEPDPESVATGIQVFADLKNLKTKTVILEGAVSTSEETLSLEIAGERQATNRPTRDGAARESRFGDGKLKRVEVESHPISHYVRKAQVSPTVLSVTTNGGELQVVSQYLEETASENWPRLVCIAPPQRGLEGELAKLGYSSVGLDDRGVSFERIS